MIINGVELQDIDILDADTAELYENAIEKVGTVTEIDTTGLKNSQIIRKYCTAIMDCFNDLFGEGTDKKVFGDKVNLIVCIKAFEELVEFANKSNPDIEKLISKYSPNRAQRRAKNNKK